MAKLYATLENSKGKTVSISDNEEIKATVYDGNMKAYSVIISWYNMGEPEGEEGGTPDYGAIITTREWRNEPEERRKVKATGTKELMIEQGTCKKCGKYFLQCPCDKFTE